MVKTMKDFTMREKLQQRDVERWLGLITFLCEVFGTMRSSTGEPFRVLVCPIYTCLREAKLRIMWENWMMEGEHSFTKTGRQCRASYATVCQWIVDAWHKVSARTVIQGFARADIIPGMTSDSIESTKTDDSDDEDTGDTGSGLLNAAIAQLIISDMEDEEFEGFMEDE
ncbi:hypothetical protein TURU_105362 [Turdus rufiventris]|nr:hypothetical protein TURU_105362 [Turdus rufiventris]